MPVSPTEFKRALGQFASGVTVVTTRDAEGRSLGLTVSAFTSVSLDPPLVLVSIDNRSEAHAGFEESGLYAVSVLREGQEHWSQRFAFGGDERWQAEFVTGASGLLLVPGALAHIECRVAHAVPGGDHTLYLGEVVSLASWPGAPLVYHAGGYRGLAGASDRP